MSGKPASNHAVTGSASPRFEGTASQRAAYRGHAARNFERSFMRGTKPGIFASSICTATCLFSNAPWARVGAIAGCVLLLAQILARRLARHWQEKPRHAAWYHVGVGTVVASATAVATAIGDGFASWGGITLLILWLYGAVGIGLAARYLAVAVTVQTIAFATIVALLRGGEGALAFGVTVVVGGVVIWVLAYVRSRAERRVFIAILELEQAKRNLAKTNAETVEMNAALAARVEAELATVIARRRDVGRLHKLLHAPQGDRSSEILRALEGPLPAPTSLVYQPGTLIGGRARIERQLGSGGFGDVYTAIDLQLRERVAVKVMRAIEAPSPSRLKRFLLEAAAAAAVDHPAIVRVLQVDVDARGTPFLITEHIEGRSLRDLLAKGPIEPAAAISIVALLANALCAVHDAGLVHRDVKPDNIMLCHKSPGLKLIDFGVSQWLGEDFALTGAGELLGSIGYMSPERFSAGAVEAQLGWAADVFATGMLLFELVAGAHPFDGLETLALLVRMKRGDFPRLDEVAPHVSRDLADFVDLMLAPEARVRPQMVTVAAGLSVLAADLGSPALSDVVERLLARPPRLRSTESEAKTA